MNKADEARLKKDPRYTKTLTAYAKLRAKLAELDEARATAKVDFEAEACLPLRMGHVEPLGDLSEQSLFDALRPKGNKCRHGAVWLGTVREYREAEIENVTAHRVTLVDDGEYDLDTGRERGGTYKIHPDDLAKIKAGELKGWRQKPWGQP